MGVKCTPLYPRRAAISPQTPSCLLGACTVICYTCCRLRIYGPWSHQKLLSQLSTCDFASNNPSTTAKWKECIFSSENSQLSLSLLLLKKITFPMLVKDPLSILIRILFSRYVYVFLAKLALQFHLSPYCISCYYIVLQLFLKSNFFICYLNTVIKAIY